MFKIGEKVVLMIGGAMGLVVTKYARVRRVQVVRESHQIHVVVEGVRVAEETSQRPVVDLVSGTVRSRVSQSVSKGESRSRAEWVVSE